MNDKHAIEMIEHYRILISSLHEDIAKHRRQMQGHIDSLSTLYYVKQFPTHNKAFAGTFDNCVGFITARGFAINKDNCDKDRDCVYFKAGGGVAQGLICNCTPLNDVWNEVYALSQVVADVD